MKLSTIFLTLISFFVILVIAGPIFVQAQILIPNPIGQESIGAVIEAITGLLRSVAIGVGGIMIVWSGIMIMTAAGSEEKRTKGKKTMMWTVIGLAIIISIDFLVGIVRELLGA